MNNIHVDTGRNGVKKRLILLSNYRGPAQSVWVADCYFIVNVLDLPFASPIAVNRQLCI